MKHLPSFYEVATVINSLPIGKSVTFEGRIFRQPGSLFGDETFLDRVKGNVMGSMYPELWRFSVDDMNGNVTVTRSPSAAEGRFPGKPQPKQFKILYTYDHPPTGVGAKSYDRRCTETVDWDFIKQYEKQLYLNHGGQSLSQLNDRGGLTYFEILWAIRKCPLSNMKGVSEYEARKIVLREIERFSK